MELIHFETNVKRGQMPGDGGRDEVLHFSQLLIWRLSHQMPIIRTLMMIEKWQWHIEIKKA